MTKTTRARKESNKPRRVHTREGLKTDRPSMDKSQDEKAAKSIKAKANEKRSFIEIVIDRMIAVLGSHLFLFANLFVIIAWIVINTGLIPVVRPFDKFPFSLLTTVVSLESIIVAILVLTSQIRASKVADLREEVQLQVNVLTEEEITRMMWMLVQLLHKNHIPIPEDQRLQELLRDTDIGTIEKSMEKQIESHK
jgi:uncharacterized membrane protein